MKCLILVSRTEHGEILLDMLKNNDKKSCFIHGKLKKKERKALYEEILNNKYDIVIASSIFDEGVDLVHFKVLILAVGGKSSIGVVQKVGRVLRVNEAKENAIIYDFIDKSKFLFNHYRRRRNILSQTFKIFESEV